MNEATDQPLRWRSLFDGSLVVFVLIAFGATWMGWGTFRALHLQSPWRQPSVLGWTLWLSGSCVSIGGIVAAYVQGGRPAMMSLLRRSVRTAAPLSCWAYALLLPFAWELPARLIVALRAGQPLVFHPEALALLVSPAVLLHFVTGPIGEELGWRGYLLPQMMTVLPRIRASLVVGFIWSLWHIPLYIGLIITNSTDWLLFIAETTVLGVLFLVLMIRSSWAISLAILFHWAVNVVPGVVDRMIPAHLNRQDLVLQSLITGAILCVLAAGLSAGLGRARAKDRTSGSLNEVQQS